MKERKGYSILVVDDEEEYQKVLSFILKNEGYTVFSASNGLDALNVLKRNNINLVLTDLKMPTMDGVELIKRIKKIDEDIEIVVMTAFGSIESAVDSIKYGAVDYFTKSDNMEELVIKIDRISKLHRLEYKNEILLKNQKSKRFYIESKNKEFKKLLNMCERVANSDINVLILGESGVGKEVIAKYIHNLSSRKDEPFIPVNCQAFPEGVIESELFGHEKGAFTGAIDSRIGKFEQANLGTLFLDEIGDLPISTQGKLLRAIENKRIEKIGSNKIINLDIRFVSATNKDLFEEISKERFREDLLYRINTLTLTIPPLRERKEDLADLINFFIEKTKEEQKIKKIKVEHDVVETLMNYDYPGNIRELKNIIERMIALSKDGLVSKNELLMPTTSKHDEAFNYSKKFREARSEFECKYIYKYLEKYDGNVAETARNMDISKRQLWNKINEFNIDIEKIRNDRVN